MGSLDRRQGRGGDLEEATTRTRRAVRQHRKFFVVVSYVDLGQPRMRRVFSTVITREQLLTASSSSVAATRRDVTRRARESLNDWCKIMTATRCACVSTISTGLNSTDTLSSSAAVRRHCVVAAALLTRVDESVSSSSMVAGITGAHRLHLVDGRRSQERPSDQQLSTTATAETLIGSGIGRCMRREAAGSSSVGEGGEYKRRLNKRTSAVVYAKQVTSG